MKKILLVVLVAFSFMFMATNVNAEEVGGQALKELDSSALDVVGDTIQIDKKESEIDLSLFDNKDIVLIRNKIVNELKENGFDTSNIVFEVTPNSQGVYLNVNFGYLDFGILDIHKVVVGININQQLIEKNINVTYSNTSNYNQVEEQDVKSKLDNIKFQKYDNTDAVYNVYSIDDENISKWNYDTYDYNNLLSDKTITVKSAVAEGGAFEDGILRLRPVNLYFFKNDILYATKSITAIGTYGFILDNGTTVSTEKKDESTEVYKEMSKELEKFGLNNIIGCYELKAYGDIYNNMKVSFDIGTQYNGRGVKILHRKDDGTFETFKTTVENGKATITVNEFSPFMIALTDDVPTPTKLSNNAQTSSMNIVFYVVLAIGSLIGITYILIKKKKIA